MPEPRHLVLGTAGHIDHGKTTLIEALTGTNTDRLPEEKRRGMTIELGFAELPVADVVFGIVDVPGHERFVRTMVAGATGIDVALIIVAADDSVMPQTVEHVEILNLLGVRHGVVAVTKCDLTETALIDVVESEVRDLLSATPLVDAPIVRVSGTARTGLDELCAALLATAASVHQENFDAPFRMPVDRVFNVAGRGLVVTGSVTGGRLERGDSVEVWPGGHRARVREIQNHNRDAAAVHAGQRAALNLQGVDKAAVERGVELTAAGLFEPTRLIDAELVCLPSHERPIKNNARLRLCIGTRELLARCVILTGKSIEPGETQYVQLRCAAPVIAAYNQRFIVRDENAARTAGGGRVLRSARRRISAHHQADVEGLKGLATGSALDRVEEVYRDAHFVTPASDRLAISAGLPQAELEAAAQERPAPISQLVKQNRLIEIAPDRLVSARFLDAFFDRAESWLERYHASHPDEPGCLAETLIGWLERHSDKQLARVLFDRLTATRPIRRLGRYVCLAAFAPKLSAADEKLLAQLLTMFDGAAFQTPSLEAAAKELNTNPQRLAKLVKLACALGELVQIDATVYIHGGRERQLRETARRLAGEQGGFSVAQLREALGSSRKYAVPMAEYLDRQNVTVRKGNIRVLGTGGIKYEV